MADKESAQEYQDKDFRDELEVSTPTHPLFPTCLGSNNNANHNVVQSELADMRTQQDERVLKKYTPFDKSSCPAQLI